MYSFEITIFDNSTQNALYDFMQCCCSGYFNIVMILIILTVHKSLLLSIIFKWSKS